MSALRRLSHAHYVLAVLLCAPLPVLLLRSLPASPLLLLPAPILLLTATKGTTSLEAAVETVTARLRFVNLLGMALLRKTVGVGWAAIAAYAVAWFLAALLAPQPGYLGPSSIVHLTSDSFDDLVLGLPPAPKLGSDPAPSSMPATKANKDQPSKRWIILFHADYSSRSRSLLIVLSRLSHAFATTSNLAFGVLTPESAPTVFYDHSVSPDPSNVIDSPPVVILYEGGKVKARLPDTGVDSVAGNGSGNESDEESEDEREGERRRARARHAFDGRPETIIKAFNLPAVPASTSPSS